MSYLNLFILSSPAHHSYTVVVGLLGGAADTALTLGPHEHFPHLG